jgi:hypothetical protein
MKSRRRITAPKAQEHADTGRLQQGFVIGEMGFGVSLHGSNLRFGSKADISACQDNVRFTPKSGH